MQLSCFLEPQMLLQYNLLWLLKEQFSTAKELLECIQSCPMHLLRYHIHFPKIHVSHFIYQSVVFTRKYNFLFLKYSRFWDFGLLWSAGGYRDYICCNTDFHLFSSLVFHDWIPMDSRKVLLFLLLHIHVFHLLLNVWHDGCCFNTWLSNCCHCHVLLPQLLELILWFSCSSPGKPTLNQTISNHFLTL